MGKNGYEFANSWVRFPKPKRDIIVVPAEVYDELLDAMINPVEPTPSIKRGAELLRKLYRTTP